MRIDGLQPSALQGAVDTNSQTQSAEAQPAVKEGAEDRVELSNTSRELSGSSLEARQQRIAEITSQVQAGTYQVDANNVADALIDQNVVSGE